MCFEKVFAVSEQGFAERRYQFIINSSLFADLITDVIEIGLAKYFQLPVFHLEEVADTAVHAAVRHLVCLQLYLQHDLLITLFH